MKTWLVSSAVALGLAIAISDTSAQTRGRQFDGAPQPATAPNSIQPAAAPGVSQPFPAGQPAPPEPMRTPSSVIVKPSGVLNKPSGVLNKPSGVVNKPSGVIGSGGTPIAAKQNFVGSEEGSRRFDGVRRGRDFRQDGFRNRSHRSSFIVVYVNGAPCWYPVYTAYPYSYGSAPVVYEEPRPVAPIESAYGEVGRMWGQDLRRDVVTWEQFVDYLRTYIIGAPPAAQAEFREAFIASYGLNGTAAYEKAAEQAAQVSSASASSPAQGPKIIDMSSGNY